MFCSIEMQSIIEKRAKRFRRVSDCYWCTAVLSRKCVQSLFFAGGEKILWPDT
jgi:hypothetical protein